MLSVDLFLFLEFLLKGHDQTVKASVTFQLFLVCFFKLRLGDKFLSSHLQAVREAGSLPSAQKQDLRTILPYSLQSDTLTRPKSQTYIHLYILYIQTHSYRAHRILITAAKVRRQFYGQQSDR